MYVGGKWISIWFGQFDDTTIYKVLDIMAKTEVAIGTMARCW